MRRKMFRKKNVGKGIPFKFDTLGLRVTLQIADGAVCQQRSLEQWKAAFYEMIIILMGVDKM